MALINPMNMLVVPEDFLTFYPWPKKLVHRDYSTAAFRTAKEAFAFLQIQFWLHTDINSLMMQLYLEYGARVMEAEEQYRPGRVPGEIILEYLEDNVHYFNNVINTNFSDIVGNEE